jgi:hypothetical protein
MKDPKVTPIRPEPKQDDYTFGMSPTDRIVDGLVIVAIIVVIFAFML